MDELLFFMNHKLSHWGDTESKDIRMLYAKPELFLSKVIFSKILSRKLFFPNANTIYSMSFESQRPVGAYYPPYYFPGI